MAETETLPQSIANTKTVVLKPRFDSLTLRAIGEKVKVRLFSKFISRPNPKDLILISFENYYEPYLVIGGKYSIDYCKKHSFVLDVEDKVDKLYIAGQALNSESVNSHSKKVIKLNGEEYAHYEKETYFIMDKMMREVSPNKLSFSPFEFNHEDSVLESNNKKLSIPTDIQISFLKSRIVSRPPDLAAIIKEVFEITDRVIVYTPVYQLKFENMKNHREAAVQIDGVTGELTIIKYEKRNSDILASPPISPNYSPTASLDLNNSKESIKTEICQQMEEKIESAPSNRDIQDRDNYDSENILLGFPARISGEIFSVGDNVTAIVGDIEIFSGSNINKSLVVKGVLKIGDNCTVNGKLKALKDVIIGDDTFIDGNVVSGGNIFLGARSIIKGSIEVNGTVQMGKDASIEAGIRSNHELTQVFSDIQMIVDTKQEFASEAR